MAYDGLDRLTAAVSPAQWGNATYAYDPLDTSFAWAAEPPFIDEFTDQRAEYLGSAGHEVLQTPNLDQLGREGVRFDRCLVPNSICGPCRAVVITGKYNHINGFYNNSNCRFDSSQTTFVKLLHAAG